MAEPMTTTATGAVASVGLAALLAGAFGQVAADVMMVFLASIAGGVIALSSGRETTTVEALKFFFGSLLTSLTLAWALAGMASIIHPALNSPYTPTVIAFMIGTQSQRLSQIANKLSGKIEKKLEE